MSTTSFHCRAAKVRSALPKSCGISVSDIFSLIDGPAVYLISPALRQNLQRQQTAVLAVSEDCHMGALEGGVPFSQPF